jgi:uncharacterized protein (DUF697 family)
MAKQRPQFSIPSTKPAAAKTEWVYRSDASASTDDPYRIVAKYSQYAAAVGFIPLPGFDVAAFGGLQLRMVAELCERYNVPYTNEYVKSLIAAMVGAVAPARLAMSVVPMLGMVTGPTLGYAATWSIGKVFMRHFESGGTLATADPSRMSKELEHQLSGK